MIMKVNWDERYKDKEFAYGKEPNEFFKEWLPKFENRKILMPADGEGRNGVFAAKSAWKVTSFDLSIEGKSKAMKLADEMNVSLDYIVGDFENLDFEKEAYDAIGLIYAHFPAEKKAGFHKKLNTYLKSGGIVIFEAYSKNHLKIRMENPKAGGPTDIDMLFSKEEILADFENFEIFFAIQ